MSGAGKHGTPSASVSDAQGVRGEARGGARQTASRSPLADEPAERQPTGLTPAEPEASDGGESALRAAGMPWRLALDLMMTIRLEEDLKVEFTWGRLDGNVARLEEHARQTNRDVVHVEFGNGSAGEPTSVWLAKFARGKLVVHQDCELFRFNQKYRTELVTPTHRFRIEDDGRLKGRVTDLDEMRAARVAKTFGIWRDYAADLASRAPSSGPAAEKELAQPTKVESAAGEEGAAAG